MGLVKVEDAEAPLGRNDGVSGLNFLRTGQSEVQKHLVKLPLRPLEASDLGGSLEMSRHLWGPCHDRLPQLLGRGRRSGFAPNKFPGCFPEQVHDRPLLLLGDLRKRSQHRLVLRQALPLFGLGELVGHGLKG